MKKNFYITGLNINFCSSIINIMKDQERSVSNICVCSNKSQKEIIDFLQQNPINCYQLETFVKVFGKLPTKDQVSIIFKSKSDNFYANFLAAHYLQNKEF